MSDAKAPLLYFSGEAVLCSQDNPRHRRVRYSLQVGGVKVLLPWLMFRLLFDLAIQSSASEDGWVNRFSLTPGGEHISKYVYRLRGELSRAGINPFVLFDGDGKGLWRILMPPSSIKIHSKRLIALEDPGVTRWVMEVCSGKWALPGDKHGHK